MCGIVGVISAHSNGQTKEENACFRDMLLMDAVRGIDSTGVFSVSNEGDVSILKSSLAAGDFVRSKEFDTIQAGMYQDGMFAVGHNRAATRGAVSDANAHPFYVNDELILVQNGTMYGGHSHIADVDVDSHALAILLHKEPDIEKALNSINAAFALVWFDTRTNKLNIIRNEERPLWFVNTKDGGILFASESWIIEAGALRNGLELNGKPYLMKEDNLFSLTLDDKSKTYKHENKSLSLWSGGSGTYYGPASRSVSFNRTTTPVEKFITDADPSLGHLPAVAERIVESRKSPTNTPVYLELYDIYSRDGYGSNGKERVIVWHEVTVTPEEKPQVLYYTLIDDKNVLEKYKDLDAFRDAMEMVEIKKVGVPWRSSPYSFGDSEKLQLVMSYVLPSEFTPICKQ